MTYQMVRTIIIAGSIAVAGSLLFVIYDRQSALNAELSLVQESAKHVQDRSDVQVIERVVSKQPWADVQKGINDTVVRIMSYTAEVDILHPYKTPKQSGGVGSGFFISEEGEIITNHHVIDEAQAVAIRIPSLGKATIDVEVIATCPDRDLALLKVSQEGLELIRSVLGKVPYLKLGDSDLVHRSDELLVLGYPLGDIQIALKSSSGVVSGREHIMGRYLIQISAPINPGSSGGPAINPSGEVIGVSCAGVMGAQNVGYIIPSNEVKMILDDLRKGGLLRRPFLGVLYNNGSPELVEYLGNPKPGGCYVVDVYEGSPLSKSGVKAGDMLYELNGHAVDLYGDLKVPWSDDKVSVIDYVSRLEVGQKINAVLYRKGKRVDVSFSFGFSDLLPVHKIFPGYDEIKYEIFGGMLVQPLTLNHIGMLANNSPNLIKYMEFENEKNPVLLVTQIIPNSQIHRLELVREGSVITEMNGNKVGTLDDFRKEIRAGMKKDLLTFKTAEGAFFVVSCKKALKDEHKLSTMYHYPLSPFIQELLKTVEPEVQS